MQLPPLDLVAFDLGVGALVVEDPSPSADAAAKTSGELGELALLPLVGADLFDRPGQHLRGQDTIGFEVAIAGAVVVAVQFELPRLARDPSRTRLSIMRRSAEYSRCPGAACSIARETLTITAKGLPNRAMWARSLRITASSTDSGTPSSFLFKLCSMGPGEVHRPVAAPYMVRVPRRRSSASLAKSRIFGELPHARTGAVPA